MKIGTGLFAGEEMAFVKERYELAMDRIRMAEEEESVREPFRDYFRKMAQFLLLLEKTAETEPADRAAWENLNAELYADIRGAAYETSYANPAWAERQLGKELGSLLAFVTAELRAGIVFVFEGRGEELTSICELFLELYRIFEEEAGGEVAAEELPKLVRQAVYYFVSDYSDVTVDYRVREQLDPSLDFAVKIVMDSDLSDPTYLYRYGEFISENEIRISSYLYSLP